MKFNCELKRVVDDSYDIEIGRKLQDTLVSDLKGGLVGKIKKFAVVTDSIVVDLYGRDIYDRLNAAGLKAELFVIPEGEKSKTRQMKEFVEDSMLEKGFRRDCCVVAVGGGSVIDSAKAIGYGLANDGDVWDFYEHTRQASACLPIGVVLTIAASGSEMSNSSVITNDETLEKRGYNNDISRPVFAVMNPEITMTLPPYQTACGCTDILMHTMERYFTNGGNMEITDAIAEGLMRTVIKNAKILVDDPDNYDARAEVMWSGSLSHNGLTGCGNDGGDFASHLLEHEIGGMFDVAHGAGLAAIWGSWARYVIDSCTPRFAKFAVNVMGVEPGKDDMETGLKGIEAMEDFYRAINMPTNLKELGIDPTEEQLETMAKNARIAAGGPKGSAKKLEAEDMLKIYQMAAGK